MLPHAVSESSDKKGRETLVQYIIKATVSKERMIYDRENQKMIYTSKRGTVSYEPLDWLAAITSHIPNKGAQNVLYYDHYSTSLTGFEKNLHRS